MIESREKKPDIAQYCQSLVAAIEQKLSRPLAASVRQAFLQVPRHIFISSFFEGKQLHVAPHPCDEQAWHTWLRKIYTDEALTTKQDILGLPTSSSSQPSVMAVMLESLNVQPENYVLEVGTGTGYNAALLGHLVAHPSQITTMDIDPELICLARPCIEHTIGEGEMVLTGNGLLGYTPNAPYDRLIATGSTLPIPIAWMQQLQTGGKLVLDMRGRLSGGLLLLEKPGHERAIGRFLPEWHHIHFMSLRAAATDEVSPCLPKNYQQLPLQEHVSLTPHDAAYDCASHFSSYEQFRGQDNAVNLWLQWALPEVFIKWKGRPEASYAVVTDARTVVTIARREQGIEVIARGERPLWSNTLQAYQDWCSAGKPGWEAYTLLIDQHNQHIHMNHQGIHRMFPLTVIA
ncbi:MAG: hypothetical protein JO125_04610 [Chloroflexi bacterium]|nr:hypothetical protein [Ktedonobacteraceae bacterium]MBV9706669.1 hypothetical protein [Chloroflexota bacterium]